MEDSILFPTPQLPPHTPHCLLPKENLQRIETLFLQVPNEISSYLFQYYAADSVWILHDSNPGVGWRVGRTSYRFSLLLNLSSVESYGDGIIWCLWNKVCNIVRRDFHPVDRQHHKSNVSIELSWGNKYWKCVGVRKKFRNVPWTQYFDIYFQFSSISAAAVALLCIIWGNVWKKI